jgi:tyrosyl-tRNA synthetase
MEREDKIELLLTKGVSEILPGREYLEKLLRGKQRLSIYCGFDPTAPTLHIGHAITLRKLRHFQDLGHHVIFLIGDFTARIGDPTDKSAARTKLTEKEIKKNLKAYKKQASKFIRFNGPNPARVKFNMKWLGRMKFADVLELASLMTVDQMLKRDMFVNRMKEEKPIYIHEFMYPLMQGYDSVAMDVDGEVGGNDQLFNMLAGRTLLKTIKGKEKFVITMKLLADANGKKMGKSEGNMIALSDDPKDIYGKVMSWTDGMIVSGFELCTDYTPAQVAVVSDELAQGINPRDLKMRLAYEIVKSIAGDMEAKAAEEAFVATFQKKESVEAVEVNGNNRTLEHVLVQEGIVSSNGEVRRLAEAGAISNFDSKEVLTLHQVKSIALPGTYKIGKNRFVKVLL